MLPAATCMHACVRKRKSESFARLMPVAYCPCECARTQTYMFGVCVCFHYMLMPVCVSLESACPQGAHSVTDCPTGFINQLLLGAA